MVPSSLICLSGSADAIGLDTAAGTTDRARNSSGRTAERDFMLRMVTSASW